MEAKKQICVKITIYKGSHADEVVYYRNKLPFEIAEKWKWYFEYIAALVKVNNPKRKVELAMCVQTLLQGQEYIEAKSKTMLRAKRGLLNRLKQGVVDEDLFGFNQQRNEEKRKRIENEIAALERGEFNYYVPQTYINKIKQFIKP